MTHFNLPFSIYILTIAIIQLVIHRFVALPGTQKHVHLENRLTNLGNQLVSVLFSGYCLKIFIRSIERLHGPEANRKCVPNDVITVCKSH